MTHKRTRIKKIVLAACIIVYVGAVLSVGAYRAREDQSSTSDFDDFWLTGRHFLQTGKIVKDYGVHNYLPFFVLAMVPLSMLPLKVACVVFNAGGLAGFVLSVRLIDGLISRDGGESPPHPPGPPEEGPPTQAPLPAPASVGDFQRIAAPVGMVLVYVTGCLVMGQMALYTLAMLTLAWHCVEKQRSGGGGLWLALAVSTKVYPIVLIPFFLLKRNWRLVGAAGGGLVAMNVLLPAVVFGPAETWRLHRDFTLTSILGQSSLQLAVIDSNKMSYTNQSSALVARRTTRPTDSGVDGPDGRPRFVTLVEWDAEPIGFWRLRLARVQWLLAALQTGLAVVAVWVCRRPAKAISMTRMRHEFAAFLLLALLLSPVVWSFYYCLCYLPLALLNERALIQINNRVRVSGAILTAAIWWLATPALASPLVRMCGYHLFATFALFAAMLALSLHTKGAHDRPHGDRGPGAGDCGLVV
jgi:hypothetical protein